MSAAAQKAECDPPKGEIGEHKNQNAHQLRNDWVVPGKGKAVRFVLLIDTLTFGLMEGLALHPAEQLVPQRFGRLRGSWPLGWLQWL